ncbi:MAG: transglutaminase-like domain-containing protein [Oscillospiraceae bacterium]|nr:transglutaminase-like domain-containing protein [Oscillospiraceae bacterium]
MKAIKITLVCILFILSTVNSQLSTAYQAPLGRVYTLKTSHDPDRFAILTVDGNTIHAEGYFKDSVVEEFFISGSSLRGTESRFSRSSDGSFTAEYSAVPEATNALAVIRFDDGSTLNYRVEYNSDDGWFFGDNNLAARTAAALEDYRVIPPEISENYLSASLDPRELAETRAVLMQIVAEETEGIDPDDDYQIAKALNYWVAENIVYDRDARDNDVTEETVSIAQTLRLRRSVCIGIANTYAALLEAAGLKVLNIKGGIANPFEGVPYELLPTETIVHEWVAFWYEAESRWVYADPTWDRQGFFENGSYHMRTPVIKHFDISGLALSFDHRGDRAELRQFFPVNVGDEFSSQDSTHVVPLDEIEIETPVITTPIVTTLPPISTADEDYIYLFMTIGALSLAAIIMVIIIFRYRRP